MKVLTQIPVGVVCSTDGEDDVSVIKWSGAGGVPAIGGRIVVAINGLGVATVVGYVVEDGWLGVVATLAKVPDWMLARNPKAGDVVVFGAELAS